MPNNNPIESTQLTPEKKAEVDRLLQQAIRAPVQRRPCSSLTLFKTPTPTQTPPTSPNLLLT